MRGQNKSKKNLSLLAHNQCRQQYSDFEETVRKTATVPKDKPHKLGRGDLIRAS